MAAARVVPKALPHQVLKANSNADFFYSRHRVNYLTEPIWRLPRKPQNLLHCLSSSLAKGLVNQ